ncbi:WecB/TagA/CpsF family glycosyltransferase [Vallitaleaceae bacterium 9-2]
MKTRENILGVIFDNVTMQEAFNYGLGLFSRQTKSVIYTPNPEIVMAAYEDDDLKNNLNQADLVLPDGIGVVIGSKLIGRPLKERVAGFDFIQQLFAALKDTDYTVYFFGSKEGVAELAAEKMKKKYPGLSIAGTWHGYEKDTEKVIADINRVKPDLLLVGLGAPRQEQWISQNKERIDAKVFAGIGGSFDGMAGVVKRAPDIFIRLNLEWFYRLLKQPTRFKRMLKLPLFLIKVIIEGRNYT